MFFSFFIFYCIVTHLFLTQFLCFFGKYSRLKHQRIYLIWKFSMSPTSHSHLFLPMIVFGKNIYVLNTSRILFVFQNNSLWLDFCQNCVHSRCPNQLQCLFRSLWGNMSKVWPTTFYICFHFCWCVFNKAEDLDQYLRSWVTFISTTKICQNMAQCLPYVILWHAPCNFFYFWMSVLERVEKK